MNYDGYTKYDAHVAADYDRDRRAEEHWQAEHEFIAAYAASHALGRVLDLPVGTGRFLELLGAAEEIFGVDISDPMLAVAAGRSQSLGLAQVHLMKGDALATPFEDDMFDTVICFRLAHLLPPQLMPRLFAELARVSRGPILVQAYLAADQPSSPWSNSRIRRLLVRAAPWLVRRPQTPWAHIESFSHDRTFLERSATASGLIVKGRHRLAHYEGSSVEVLELSK